MLRQRLLTIGLLLPIVYLGILYFPQNIFRVACGIMILLAAWEWAVLMGLNGVYKYVYVALICILLPVSLFISLNLILWTAIVWWLLGMFWIVTYPKNTQWSHPYVLAILGIEVLIPCWLALVNTRELYGPYLLLSLLALVWGADTGAYAIGKSVGRNKLLPIVSPGKTIEGVMGGIIFGIISFSLVSWLAGLAIVSWLTWLILAFLCIVISVFGDLLISMLKRFHGVKDSGVLLPGHGGILDRIDSITAAAPCFLLALLYGNFIR